MLYIQHAEVYTITQGVMKDATIIIENGKIKEVGTSIPIPEGANVVNAQGKIVTPGLIDVHTHLGILEEAIGPAGADVNELTEPSTPHLRALDAINPMDRGFKDAYEAGVTTVQVMPGSGNVIGGEMSILKTYGRIVDEMVIKETSALKVALGENPKRVYGSKNKMPSTRMGIAAILREQLVKAQNYKAKLRHAEQNPETLPPDRDLKLEVLVKVLNKEIQIRAHAHRADDIVTAIRIAKEFDLDLTIEHCTEGHLIPDYIKEAGFPVSVGPTMSSRSKVELGDKGWHTLVALAKHAVPVSITTDHPVVPIDYLITAAALAVSEGLEEEIAWKALTLYAAQHMRIDDRVGSIEAGKDADLVIWTHNPLRYYQGKVDTTMINGCIVYQREHAN